MESDPPATESELQARPLLHTGSVTDVAFSASGRTLFSSGMEGARAFRVEGGKELWHCPGVFVVAAIPGGDDLVGATSKGLALLDGATGAVRDVFSTGRFMPTALAVSKTELLAATASGSEVRLWDLGTRKLVRELVPAKGTLERLAMCGQRLFALAYGKVIAWDLTTGAQLASLRPGPRQPRGIVADRDGQRLFVGGDEAILQISFERKKPAVSPFLPAAGAMALALSPDGARMAVASSRGLEVWELSGKLLAGPLPLSDAELASVVFSPAGDRLAVAGEAQKAWLCSPASDGGSAGAAPAEPELEGHSGTILSMVVRGDRVLTGSADGTARVWDLASGKSLETLEGPGGPVLAVAWDDEGAMHLLTSRAWRVLDAAGGGEAVKAVKAVKAKGPGKAVIKTEKAAKAVKAKGPGKDTVLLPDVLSGALDPQGRWCLGLDAGTLTPWLHAPGKKARAWALPQRERITHLAVSEDGRFLALGIVDERLMGRSVELRHAPKGTVAARLSAPELEKEMGRGRLVGGDSALQAVAISRDGSMAAAAPFRGPVVVWDVATGDVRARLAVDDLVIGLVFTGSSLAVVQMREGLRFFSLEGPKHKGTRRALPDEPACARALPDGGLIVGFKRGRWLRVDP